MAGFERKGRHTLRGCASSITSRLEGMVVTQRLSEGIEHWAASGSRAQVSPPKPSDPAEALQRLRSSPGNRRGEFRATPALLALKSIGGQNSVFNRCTLSDIGSGGCYVEMPSPFESRTLVEIIVRTQNMKIRVCGTVQSVHPGFGMGVRFTLKSASEREHVERLVSLVPPGPRSTKAILGGLFLHRIAEIFKRQFQPFF